MKTNSVDTFHIRKNDAINLIMFSAGEKIKAEREKFSVIILNASRAKIFKCEITQKFASK